MSNLAFFHTLTFFFHDFSRRFFTLRSKHKYRTTKGHGGLLTFPKLFRIFLWEESNRLQQSQRKGAGWKRRDPLSAPFLSSPLVHDGPPATPNPPIIQEKQGEDKKILNYCNVPKKSSSSANEHAGTPPNSFLALASLKCKFAMQKKFPRSNAKTLYLKFPPPPKKKNQDFSDLKNPFLLRHPLSLC